MAVYRSEPIIIETMKAENMIPNGRVVVLAASCNVGTQTKTKRYIEPSKQVCVSPKTSRRGSREGQRQSDTSSELGSPLLTIFQASPNLRN